MKKTTIIFFILQMLMKSLPAQDFGGEKISLSNFAKRMYNIQKFEGVKVLQSPEGIDYIISVVSLKKDSTKSAVILNRIACIKAKVYVSQYLDGSQINSEVIVITTQKKINDSLIVKTSMRETLKENSIGFIDGMELLTNFENSNENQIVYIYYRELKMK